MSDRSSVALRVLGPRATLQGAIENSLEGVNTQTLPDGAACFVSAEGKRYSLNRTSTASPSPPTIIAPLAGPGRWIVDASGGGGGAQGAQGFQGARGAQGSQGTQGSQGASGSGAQGSQGSQGSQGASGAAAVVVSNAANGLAPQISAGNTALIANAGGTAATWDLVTQAETKGGLPVFADVTERNAYPIPNRVVGMTAYQVDSDSLFRLIGGTGNGNWSDVTIGLVSSSSPGIVPAVGAANSLLQSTGTAAAWSTFLSLGAAPAASGAIRLSNTQLIVSRNSTNTLDVNVYELTAGNVQKFGSDISATTEIHGGTSGINLQIAGAQKIGLDSNTFYAVVPQILFTANGGGTQALINVLNTGTATGQFDLVLRAQGTSAAAGVGGTGRLQGGHGGAGGLNGGAAMQFNVDDTAANMQTMVECRQLTTTRRVTALNLAADVSTTQLPANTGDLVTFIANAAAAPTAAPVGGFTFYSTAGNPGVFTPNALQTTVGAAGAASAQPITPAAYMPFNHNGVLYAIPMHTHP